MNKKNYLKFFIICMVIVLFIALISTEAIDKKENRNNVYAIIDNKVYSLEDIDEQYGKNFIRKIDKDKVIVYNGETTYTCKYNEECEIWPDSGNGQIMWSAPLMKITFKKQNIAESQKTKKEPKWLLNLFTEDLHTT